MIGAVQLLYILSLRKNRKLPPHTGQELLAIIIIVELNKV